MTSLFSDKPRDKESGKKLIRVLVGELVIQKRPVTATLTSGVKSISLTTLIISIGERVAIDASNAMILFCKANNNVTATIEGSLKKVAVRFSSPVVGTKEDMIEIGVPLDIYYPQKRKAFRVFVNVNAINVTNDDFIGGVFDISPVGVGFAITKATWMYIDIKVGDEISARLSSDIAGPVELTLHVRVLRKIGEKVHVGCEVINQTAAQQRQIGMLVTASSRKQLKDKNERLK